MPERIIKPFFELTFILPFGFLTGYIIPGDIDLIRIIVSIIGTIVGGTVWVFIKPCAIRIRNKLYNSKKNKNE